MIEQVDEIPEEVIELDNKDIFCCNEFKSMIKLDRLMNVHANYCKCPYCGNDIT